ncbi:hypothetical protein [Pedobacter sp. NJ-S-72]
MEFLFVFWIVFQVLAGINLVLPLILYILRVFKKKEILNPAVQEVYDYAVIVTAYEQTTLLPSVVDSILKLNYHNYMIYVVADKCDISGLILTMKGSFYSDLSKRWPVIQNHIFMQSIILKEHMII